VVRAVIDTSIFVRALINPKSRCGRLLFQYADLFTIIISKPIAQELLEVVQRPELTRKYRGLTKLNMRLIIDVVARAEAVEIGDVPSKVRDPNDDMFVATALAGAAEYIVSEDNDLLSLGQVGIIRIVAAETFIRLFE
jgi:uncharacterized protein